MWTQRGGHILRMAVERWDPTLHRAEVSRQPKESDQSGWCLQLLSLYMGTEVLMPVICIASVGKLYS